jgi:uronate dehydrogenase
MKRLLITGAAGNIGQMARKRLAGLAEVIRLSDVAMIEDLAENEEFIQCDLSDESQVAAIVAGCDAIVHLGGVSVERTYDLIEAGNIRGVYNLYEAARTNGNPRIFFASSNHTIGYYRQTEHLTADMPLRPDTLYGVSKAYGEAMAKMYFEKFGVETAIVRIGSCVEKPENRRALSTWLSFDDFTSLVRQVFDVPVLGCPIIWGVSNNAASFWDNSAIAYIGWSPKDNAEEFRAEVEAIDPGDPDDPVNIYQGGFFTAEPIYK